MARKMKFEDIVKGAGWLQAEGSKWDPNVGDSIIGVFKKVSSKPKPNKPGEKITTYQVESDEKVWRITGTTILDDLMSDGPEVGGIVAIKLTRTAQNPYNRNKPTKYYDVYYKKPEQESKEPEKPIVSEKEKVQPETNEDPDKKLHANELNLRDNTEIGEIVNGIEEDLKDTGTDLTELNMFKAAKTQLEYDKKTLELANAEIRNRDYPKRTGA